MADVTDMIETLGTGFTLSEAPVQKKNVGVLHLEKNWRPSFSHHRPRVSCQFS